MLTTTQTEDYHRNGYTLVPAVFSPSEVAAFKQAVDIHRTTDGKDVHLFAVDSLRDLWRDPRLVTIARRLIGDPLVFFGEANFTSFRFSEGEHIGGRHLHHDAKGTPAQLFDRLHAPMNENYPVVRFAVYLQDYANQSGGLKVSPGSHKINSASFEGANLSFVNLPTRPGDVACFTLRVLHSPFGLRLKEDPNRCLSPWEEDVAFTQRPDLFLPSPHERDTLFVDYARESAFADLQIKSRALNAKHRQSRTGFLQALETYDIAAAAQTAGVGLRMDYAVVDAVLAFAKMANDPEAKAGVDSLLAMIPALCRRSVGWTPHFSLFSQAVADDSRATAKALAREILPRILEFQETLNARRLDGHMGELKASAIRDALDQLAS